MTGESSLPASLAGTLATGLKATGGSFATLGSDLTLLLGVHAGKALVARTAVARGGVVVGSLSAASAVASLATLGSNLAHLLLGTVGKVSGVVAGHF